MGLRTASTDDWPLLKPGDVLRERDGEFRIFRHMSKEGFDAVLDGWEPVMKWRVDTARPMIWSGHSEAQLRLVLTAMMGATDASDGSAD